MSLYTVNVWGMEYLVVTPEKVPLIVQNKIASLYTKE